MTGASNPIRVAIAGVGNCASSLLQGVEYYKDADPSASSMSGGRAGASATARGESDGENPIADRAAY